MRRRPILGLLFAAALWAQPAPDAAQATARRYHQALVADGYNLTYGLSLDGAPARVDFLVPETGDDHAVRFWISVTGGEATARLVGKDGKAVFAWSGSQGDLALACRIPAGACHLEVEMPAGARGLAEFGVKGPLMSAYALNAATQECAPVPQAGFRWPYLLFKPAKVRFPCLLVVPDNTGFATEDPELLRAAGAYGLQQDRGMAERLGCPVLVPLFPRPKQGGDDLYLHALTRASLEADEPVWKRVDLQLAAMVDDARARLAGAGTPVGAKVLISGFSASGSFANRFALLHPDRVLAAACGSPGGWPTAPAARSGADSLPYPVGLADAKALTGRAADIPALKAVRFFFYMGDQDANDAVPYRDSFSEADQALIFRRFGTTPVARWKAAEGLYAAQGLDARFKLYPGAAHSVTGAMAADVEAFFRSALEAAFPAR